MRVAQIISENRHQLRGKGGRFAPRPVPRPLPPRESDTLDFTKTPGIKPIQPANKPKPRRRPAPAPQQPKPEITQQQPLGLQTSPAQPKQTGPQRDLFGGDSNDAKGLSAQNASDAKQVQADKATQQWNALASSAAQSKQFGQQLMTLIGVMYQAKRRNPDVQISEPKMISAMRADTAEQKAMQTRLKQAYQQLRNQSAAQLAQSAQQIQKARKLGSSEQAQQAVTPQAQPREMNTLRSINQLLKRSNPQQLGQIKTAVDKEISNRTSNS